MWQKYKIIGQREEVNKNQKVSCLHNTNKENYIEGSKETREITVYNPQLNGGTLTAEDYLWDWTSVSLKMGEMGIASHTLNS